MNSKKNEHLHRRIEQYQTEHPDAKIEHFTTEHPRYSLNSNPIEHLPPLIVHSETAEITIEQFEYVLNRRRSEQS